jgi:uncharacterized protein GlcG (DUF336 family)
MRSIRRIVLSLAVIAVLPSLSEAQGRGGPCAALPGHTDLRVALSQVAVNEVLGDNGGFGLNMWGTVVNRDGEVCAVAFTGGDRGDQWPGSRVISAQKANTANAFSLPGLNLSTANLFSAVQPGGSLFGLQESNPVDVGVAYGGSASNYGQHNDRMIGKKVGGVNVFGGGLALYDPDGALVGAIGVSGDTSCADHAIAWRTRQLLGLDNTPIPGFDNIQYDIAPDANGHPVSAGGFGHPECAPGSPVP